MFIGFDRDRNRRRDELTSNKNIKDMFHIRIMFKKFSGFSEHQEKATYGLGFKLTLPRKKHEAVIDKAASNAGARIEIDNNHWYVPHYTPSIQQQGVLSKQIFSKTPTELRYFERSVFMKDVKNQN